MTGFHTLYAARRTEPPNAQGAREAVYEAVHEAVYEEPREEPRETHTSAGNRP